MNEYTPYMRFAAAMLRDAIRGAKKGDVYDILWLLSDDAEHYIDMLDRPRERYVKIAVDAIKRKHGRSSVL